MGPGNRSRRSLRSRSCMHYRRSTDEKASLDNDETSLPATCGPSVPHSDTHSSSPHVNEHFSPLRETASRHSKRLAQFITPIGYPGAAAHKVRPPIVTQTSDRRGTPDCRRTPNRRHTHEAAATIGPRPQVTPSLVAAFALAAQIPRGVQSDPEI